MLRNFIMRYASLSSIVLTLSPCAGNELCERLAYYRYCIKLRITRASATSCSPSHKQVQLAGDCSSVCITHHPDPHGCCCSISTNLVEYLTSPDILNFDLVTGNNTVSIEPALQVSPPHSQNHVCADSAAETSNTRKLAAEDVTHMERVSLLPSGYQLVRDLLHLPPAGCIHRG